MSSETIRILHVDDDPDLVDLAATFLERKDSRFTVETATSTTEGLQRLSAAVDCIVSDYDMPDMNGIEFLETIRGDYPELPFILFTGKGSEEIASEAISAGVTEYLQKETGSDQYTVLANRIGNAVDQFRSHRKFEASQQRLSLFVEQSPLGVLEYNEDFEIVGLNEAGEDILGYSEAELQGETWEKIVTSSSYENVDEVTSALAEAEGGYHSIDQNVRKDGEIITCEWHNRVITDAEGDVVAIFSQFQDITDRKEREERLQQTSARLKALFDNSPVMINIHDAAGNIIDPNPRLCEMTGYDKSEITEMKVWDLDQTISRDQAFTLWEQMEVGEQRNLEAAYQRRDGSTFPVKVHVSCLALDGKDRFVAISRDITDEKERERDLKRYQAMVENTEDGIYVFDEQGRFKFVNQRVVDVSGIPQEGWVDEHVSILADLGTLTEAEVHEVEQGIEAIVHGDKDESRIEVYPDVPHDLGILEIRLTPFQPTTGENHVIGFSRDVTERKEYEQELEEQNKRLKQFASNASHDLRNPLHVAAGQLELARTECDSEHLDTVADAIERGEELIDDLLRRAREGEGANEWEPVPLAETVETCWQTIQTEDATLVLETDRTIQANQSRVQQFFENLIRNAIEHGADDVTITVGDSDGGFYVADDGPGIPAEERENVFQRGYSTSEDSTGFGLPIVKRIAETHDWKIQLTESNPGGTQVQICDVTFVSE